MNTDYVYYLVVQDEVLQEPIFSSQEEALVYASAYIEAPYYVLPWSVD